MVSLLLAAGANVNARNCDGETPLSVAVSLEDSYPEQAADNWLEVVTLLLKRGASLDECRSDNYDDNRSAEDAFNQARAYYVWGAEDENVLAVKALLDGVRKHGSHKRYMRAPHRDVLACRGLAQRGKLATEHRALNFIARQGDNGIVWTVLSYWRATD